MADNLNRRDLVRIETDIDQLDTLASRALKLVAARVKPEPDRIQDALVLEVVAAVQVFDPEQRTDLIEKMIHQGISREAIIDLYIPAAARLMGVQWCEDEMSFADVTIGLARLQGILRDLSAAMTNPQPLNGPTILVALLKDAYHTLGASVLTQQLRRMGFSVVLSIGADNDEIAQKVLEKDFDMIMISASGAERLDLIRRMVDNIKRVVDDVPPLVLGGNILEQDADVKALTDVDYLSMDPNEALRLCGLTIPVQNGAPSVLGS